MAGHPVHPALVHFPIGAWGIATPLDLLVFAGLRPLDLWPVASGLIAMGLATALLAMAAGVYDLVKIVKQQNALLNSALIHVGVMAIVWCVYLTSLLMRFADGALASPSSLPVFVSVFALAGLVLGGWLGGNLVYRFGANVTPVLGQED